MSFWRKLLALAAGLPVLAAAADPEMMSLIMPDANMVMEINIAKIVASPIGAAMKDSFQQGVSARLKGEITKSNPQFQEQIAQLANIDWSREVQDVVIAGRPGKQSGGLVIVRSSLTAERLQAMKGFLGGATDYAGVSIMESSKPGNGVMAFLGDSILLLGQMQDVKAAIDRRRQNATPAPFVAAQTAKYGNHEFWLAAAGPLTPQSLPGAAGSSPAGATALQFLQKLSAFDGGIRLTPDFELSANIEARDLKAAAEMADGLRWVTSAVQSQAKMAGKAANGLEGFKYQLNGRRIALSLHVPEEKIRAGLRQMQATQASQAAAATVAPTPTPSPRVPPGMISVQSSEGTVLIPTDKDQ